MKTFNCREVFQGKFLLSKFMSAVRLLKGQCVPFHVFSAAAGDFILINNWEASHHFSKLSQRALYDPPARLLCCFLCNVFCSQFLCEKLQKRSDQEEEGAEEAASELQSDRN